MEAPTRKIKNQKQHYLYDTWKAMLERCHNPASSHYDYYGGRGIRVCNEWKASFDAFVFDMGLRPDNHTLDRIDNDKGYRKENCRWASSEQQHFNKRKSSKKLKYVGKQTAIKEMLKDLGHKVILRILPVPSVFLDAEPSARFFADTWPEVYAKVKDYCKIK